MILLTSTTPAVAFIEASPYRARASRASAFPSSAEEGSSHYPPRSLTPVFGQPYSVSNFPPTKQGGPHGACARRVSFPFNFPAAHSHDSRHGQGSNGRRYSRRLHHGQERGDRPDSHRCERGGWLVSV